MANDGAIPGEADRRAFIEKLTRFRAGLSTEEQRMLDAVLAQAMSGAGHEVQGYGMGEQLMAMLAEWISTSVPVDEEGRPLPYTGM
jgi:hypothetical protein